MKNAALLALFAAFALAQPQRQVDEFATTAGPVRIAVVSHASMMVEGGGEVIQIDPVGVQRYASLPQAEVRLRDRYQAGDEAAALQRGAGRGAAPQRREGRAETPQAAPARPAAVVSPQILPDGRVMFRLRAPNARDVTITGDFGPVQNRSEKLVKDDQGVWSITLGPFPPDLYSYAFNVDGTSIPDPVNGFIKPGVSTTQSMFLIPGDRAAFLQAAPVPHGDVRIVHFQSAVAGGVRRMHIYVPPGYDGGKKRYPVMYLLHGGGDDDGGWVAIGRANLILDNLIAQGKAAPMIVVMPSIWALDPPVPADRRDANNALFVELLIRDVMPYVEKNYRALATPKSRALGGLSYPNILPDIWVPNIEKFDYVGFTSNGLNADRIAYYEKQYPGVLDNPANVKRVKVYIGDGANAMTFASAKNLAEDLKQRGYKTVFSTTDGIHGWPWFRRYFAEFAQMAFR